MTPEDYLHWKKHPVTIEILDYLRQERELWDKTLTEGRTLKGERTAEETGKAVGIIYGIDLMLEMRNEDVGE